MMTTGPWGLFRHYWVLTKLVLTLLATVILFVLQAVGNDAVRDRASIKGNRRSVTTHPSGATTDRPVRADRHRRVRPVDRRPPFVRARPARSLRRNHGALVMLNR